MFIVTEIEEERSLKEKHQRGQGSCKCRISYVADFHRIQVLCVKTNTTNTVGLCCGDDVQTGSDILSKRGSRPTLSRFMVENYGRNTHLALRLVTWQTGDGGRHSRGRQGVVRERNIEITENRR